MNIIEAVKLGVHGNKIRRSCWLDNQYIIIEMFDELMIVTFNDNASDTIENYIATTTSILAQDWELYNDPIIEDKEDL